MIKGGSRTNRIKNDKKIKDLEEAFNRRQDAADKHNENRYSEILNEISSLKKSMSQNIPINTGPNAPSPLPNQEVSGSFPHREGTPHPSLLP